MGFLNKIKDLFIDEEEIIEEQEIEVEKKEEHKLPTFMREKIEKEEHEKQKVEEKKEEKQTEKVSDMELVKNNDKFRFPIQFEDKDFETTVYSRQNVIKKEIEKPKKVSELYTTKKDINDKPKKFTASPIISPVYGVLDQNYKKEELKEKESNSYEIKRNSSKKVDFESVRKKAFGSLADDIQDNLMCENCELLKEVKRIEKLEADDLLYDLTEDKEVKETDKDITIATAEENYYDFGVAYEPVKEEIKEVEIEDHNDNNEIENIITKEPEEVIEETIDIPNLYTEKQEDEDVVSIKEEEKKEKDIELTDDLFNLIDSMYEEGEE